MAIGTYAELQTAIANWLKRADLTERIPEFIALTEAKINNEVRIQPMEKRATATCSTSSRFMALPERFARMEKVQINASPIRFPEFLAHNQMRDFYDSSSGKPFYYTIWGDELEFERVPDSAYEVEMYYHQKVQALSATNTTNDILTEYPNIYLYGALIQAEPYMMNDKRINTWGALYQDAVDSANGAAEEASYSGPLQMRAGRVNP